MNPKIEIFYGGSQSEASFARAGELRRLAMSYNAQAEAFDAALCRHRDKDGVAMPLSAEDKRAVIRHARLLLDEMIPQVRFLGFSVEQFLEAIRGTTQETNTSPSSSHEKEPLTPNHL